MTRKDNNTGGEAPTPPLLTPEETAEELHVSLDQLEQWRTTGGGPAWIRVNRRRIRYAAHDVEQWKQQNQ